MIRIHLTATDIENVRIADGPDFGAELSLGAGLLLAFRPRNKRLVQWQTAVRRRRHPRTSQLTDLYTSAVSPGFFNEAVQTDRSETAAAIASVDPSRIEAHLRDISGLRSLTPFARALGDGEVSAFSVLGRAVADLQAVALDPYRTQIASVTASSTAVIAARMARQGIGGAFRTLHPGVGWNGTTLAVGTDYEADVELGDRVLVLQPTALADVPIVSWDVPGALTVHIPTVTVLVPTRANHAENRALRALLGPARAAALAAISSTPALTTGQLAEALGLSAATASRHAAVLRDAGLITTFRAGMTVHHVPTPLGHALLTGPAAPGASSTHP